MKNNTDTEIDLWELLSDCLKLFKKRKVIILSFFLLGMVFGFVNFLTHPLEYKSFYRKEFIAQSSVASDEIIYDIINNIPLNTQHKSADRKDTFFSNFRNIKGKLLANGNKETRLKVTIEVFSLQDIDSALNALTTYINSIENLREEFKFQQQQQQKLLSVVNEQISSLDTTKKNVEDLGYITVFEKKQNLEKELFLKKIINFIPINPDSIIISNTRARVLNVLGYSFLGLVIGFLIGYIWNLIQRKPS